VAGILAPLDGKTATQPGPRPIKHLYMNNVSGQIKKIADFFRALE